MLVDRFPCAPDNHTSFLLRKNKVISIGHNQRTKTHPLSAKMGYPYQTIHAELDAVVKADSLHGDLTMFNVRRTKAGAIGLAKPCRYCRFMLEHFGINEVWYTTDTNEFDHEVL